MIIHFPIPAPIEVSSKEADVFDIYNIEHVKPLDRICNFSITGKRP